jgi:hypothetical protein
MGIGLTEGESWQVLVALGSSFVGATLGTLVTIAFTRRSASEQAIGEEFSKRRIELICQLANLLSRVATKMDANETGGQTPDSFRDDYAQLAKEFSVAMTYADLYFSEPLFKQLRRYESWIEEEVPEFLRGDGGPDYKDYRKLRLMLSEAMQGDHNPQHEPKLLRWLRVWFARKPKTEPKFKAPKLPPQP